MEIFELLKEYATELIAAIIAFLLGKIGKKKTVSEKNQAKLKKLKKKEKKQTKALQKTISLEAKIEKGD